MSQVRASGTRCSGLGASEHAVVQDSDSISRFEWNAVINLVVLRVTCLSRSV